MNVAHGGRRRLVRRIGLAASLGLAGMALAGCSLTDIKNPILRAGWPDGVTPEAQRMRELWTWSIVAAMTMGLIVWGLVFWTLLFHRKKKNSPDFPRQTQYNVPLELAYTAAPFVAIAVLFFFTVQTQNYVNENPSNPDVTVDVTALQWNWQFGYRQAHTAGYNNPPDPSAEDPDRKLNRHFDVSPEVQEAKDRGQTGMREDWSYLYDDQITTVGSTTEIPVLVLPVDQSVRFTLASRDVIHSFWVPEFLFKRDVMPFPEANQSRNVFTIDKIDHPGAFVGRCAEMCGTYHSMMNFEVRAVPEPLFSEYMEIRDPQRNGGKQVSNADALAALQQRHSKAVNPAAEDNMCDYNGTDVCTPTAITTHPFEQRFNQAAAAATEGK
nr:cytochrome c oxidase subunit II [Tomitella gaofuii]